MTSPSWRTSRASSPKPGTTRTRPCLQYQIKRCSGPCVGLVSEEDYAQDVQHTIQFLEGKTGEVIEDLAARMERAAGKLEFERAALLRDQMRELKRGLGATPPAGRAAGPVSHGHTVYRYPYS